MNYIVLDLEFNQPFQFQSGSQTILNPECPFEIIQIGAVKLNQNFEYLESFNFFIKPQIYKRIHPFVEKITGITQEQLRDCPFFPDAYHAFVQFIGNESSVLCTWGVDDIKSLFKNILYYNLKPNLITDKYLNVQSFANMYLHYEPGKTIGLKNAVTLLNLPIDAEFHNALHDAQYTAQIFKIVHPDNLVPDTFHILDLAKKKEPKTRLHTKAFLQYFQNSIGRELTEEEISMLKSAYKLGRNRTYDISNEKYKKMQKKEGKK